MVDRGLFDYVKDGLAQGKTKEEITSSLSGNGWNQVDIDAAFAAVQIDTATSLSGPAAAASAPQQITSTTVEAPTLTVAPTYGRFRASRMLVSASLQMIWDDPTLLVFPFLQAIFLGLFCAIFFILVFLGGSYLNIDWQNIPPYILWPSTFVYYFCSYFIYVFFTACIMSIIRNQLSGQGGTGFIDGLRGAGSKVGKLFLWALVASTVILVIDILRSQQKKGVAGTALAIGGGALQLTWNIASNFALPAIVVENAGPWAALEQSVATLKRTWGETIIMNVGTSLYFSVLYFLLVASGFGVAYFVYTTFEHVLFAEVLVVIVWGVAFIVLTAFSSVASSIFKIVTYEYAALGQNAKGFSPQLLAFAMGKFR
jgi:hypothetical protein